MSDFLECGGPAPPSFLAILSRFEPASSILGLLNFANDSYACSRDQSFVANHDHKIADLSFPTDLNAAIDGNAKINVYLAYDAGLLHIIFSGTMRRV